MRRPGFPSSNSSNSQKKEARILLYRRASERPRAGAAIALAGPAPEDEIDLLRYYLRWPGHRTWLVDNSTRPEVRAGLARARKLWPEAHVESENLRVVLRQISTIGFANLDFTGYLTDTNLLPCLTDTVKRMVTGAVLGLTWYRGRENLRLHRSARRVFYEGRDQTNIADRRWAGTLRVVDEVVDGKLGILDALEYHNGQSPMAMVVYEKK